MAISKESVILEFKIDSKGVVTNVDQINKKLSELGTNAKIAQKGFTDMNSAAGIAGSTVTEFGRLVSDLPYGIQGVANNLSQLGSMFALLTVEASKMKNGLSTAQNTFNLLRSQILGPVGILVAFQGLIAGLEAFSRSQNKATKEVENFNESVFLETQALDMLQKQLDLVGDNEDERLRILKVLALASKDYRKILEDEDLTVSEKVYKGEVLLTQQRAINAANESLAKSHKLVSENQDRGVVTLDEYNAALKDLEGSTEQVGGNLISVGGALVRTENVTKSNAEATKELYEAQQNIIIQSGLLVNLEQAKQNLLEKGKPFVDGSTDAIKLQIKELENQRDALATTTEQIDYYNDRIDVLKGSLTKLVDPKEQVTALATSQAAGLEQNVNTIIKKTVENTKVWGDVKKLNIKGLSEALDPEQMEKDLTARLSLKKGQLDMSRLLGLKEQAENIGQRAELVKNIASSLNDILSAQADREIAIEKNKTTALNDQLKRRLANENLSAEERDKINQQISRNEAKLVERQNAIAKKQFQREKALKIVMALSDTASSAMKAYLSQFLPLPDPSSPARGTAAAAIATAFGLAQVAAISRLKYTEQGLPTPNLTAQGGGGAPAAQGPAFNIIGAGGQSQLAQAVASQQRSPVKAYVVSGEVTTAQALERNKVEQASI